MPFWPYLTRGNASTMKLIVRIIHLINTEHSFQTALVESFVMGYKRESGNLRFNLLPYIGEYWSIFSIFSRQSMYLTAPVIVVFRFWFYERIELINLHAITIYDNTNTTNRTTFVICCFKIYCCKVFHLSSLYLFHILLTVPAISLRSHRGSSTSSSSRFQSSSCWKSKVGRT